MAEARLLLLFSVFLLCRSVNYASNEKEKMLANEGLAQCKQAESEGHPCIEVPGSASYASNEKEKTLAMIKPDGLLGNHSDKVKDILLKSGFDILKEMMVQLDEHNVTLFYAEHSKKSFFPSLIKYMTSGPVLVMVLEKENAVADWRALIGPTDAKKAKTTHPESIRAMCGTDSSWNCVHGSDSPKSASREISFFFGEIYLTVHEVPEHKTGLLITRNLEKLKGRVGVESMTSLIMVPSFNYSVNTLMGRVLTNIKSILFTFVLWLFVLT